MKSKIFLVSILLIGILFISGCIETEIDKAGLPNPAAVYCEEQGGTVEIRNDPRPEGGQYGVCILENGTECDEWAYHRGGCESCLTYCVKRPHIMCVGYWNITGEYPDCHCEFICSTE